MNKINRIVAYGCSYTAGDELMDHVKMGMTFDECNQIKQRYANNTVTQGYDIAAFRKDFELPREYPLHRNSSWAAILARQLNISFENRAINGSGLDEHYFKIYNDYTIGQIKDTDLVLIGLTTADRTIDFRPNRLMPHNISFISGMIPNKDSSKLLLELWNDDFLVFHYFRTIHLLHFLSLKINLLMQPMRKTWTPSYIHTLDIPHTKHYVDSIWNECTSSILSELYLEDTTPLCGFGHPSVESHMLLAEQLEELVRNKFQLLHS